MLDAHSPADLKAILTRLLSEAIVKSTGSAPDEIDPDASLTSFGLDSLAMVTLVAALEDELAIDLEPELAFNYPTVNALAAYISNVLATKDVTAHGDI